MDLEQIPDCVIALLSTRSHVLVAIDGQGGAGKSTLARRISDLLLARRVRVQVVHVDDFFLPSADRPTGSPEAKPIGSDFDWPRLRDEVLSPLRRGQAARYRRYDWAEDALADTCEVIPTGVIIVEGVYSIRTELAPLYDLRIWVECPRDLRLERGLARDGADARARWEEDWIPSEDRYLREQWPRERAEIVIDGSVAAQPAVADGRDPR